MTVVDLATYCMPEDRTSPALVGGYVVACTTFYEWGFGVPSHQFLCSLLQSMLGAAAIDSFGDPAYGVLHDPMRGLYGD
jgi:hypothetical protein